MTPLQHLEALAFAWRPRTTVFKSSRDLKPVFVFEERTGGIGHNQKLMNNLGILEQYVERKEGNYLRIAIPE
jgi:hypothetical protein